MTRAIPGLRARTASDGAKGDKGDPEAAPGAKGDKGDPGTKGTNGHDGARATRAIPGTTARGAKGDKGDKGDPGLPGRTTTLSAAVDGSRAVKAGSSPGTTGVRSGLGNYQITFSRSVSGCPAVASAAILNAGTTPVSRSQRSSSRA